MYTNICVISGRAGSDAEMYYLPSGTAVTQLNIAFSERYMKDGEWKENTHWVPLRAMGDVAERLANVQKGDMIIVNGSFEARPYKAQDGTNRTSYGIKVRSFNVLLRRKTDNDTATVASTEATRNESTPDTDEDAPF